MSSGKYSSIEPLNKHIIELMQFCREDPNIQGLMLVGSIGRKEEDGQSDINAEIFMEGKNVISFTARKPEVAMKLSNILLAYNKNETLIIVFNDLVVLTAKFIAIETANPQLFYQIGQILIDKLGLVVKLVERSVELAGKLGEEGIETARVEVRKLLIDMYNEFKRQNFWEAKKILSEIRLTLVQIYTASCGTKSTNINNISEFAEDWFVEGLRRCVISSIATIPRSINLGITLLNEIEQHCHLKESPKFKDFDTKLTSLIKGSLSR